MGAVCIPRRSDGGTTNCFHQSVQGVAAYKSLHDRRLPARIAGISALRPLCPPRLGGLQPADPRLFFQPVKFHLQSANLAEQPLWITMRGNRFGTSAALKQCFCLILNLFLLMPDCHRVDTILLANLVDRLDSTYYLQTYLCLKLGSMEIPRLRFTHHRSSL